MTESTIRYLFNHKQELFRDKVLWLFIFLCIIISVFEIVITVLTESLSGYADCVHRLQHVFEYVIIVIANVFDKRKKDEKYSFGYGRHEYLFVFTLNLSVIMICCFLLFEAIHGFSDGHHLHIDEVSPSLQRYADYLNYISFAISLVTIFGFRFYKRQYHNRYSADIFRAKSKAHAHISKSDIIHIVIDLSTIGFMIVSNYLSMKKGLVIADVIECCVMCIFMICTSWSDLAVASSVLVMGISDELAQEIRTVMKRVSMLDGVVSMKEPYYWVESPGHLVGMLTVIASQDIDIKQLRMNIQSICSNTFQEIAIQIDQHPSYTWLH